MLFIFNNQTKANMILTYTTYENCKEKRRNLKISLKYLSICVFQLHYTTIFDLDLCEHKLKTPFNL